VNKKLVLYMLKNNFIFVETFLTNVILEITS